jgi:hypothetical protein
MYIFPHVPVTGRIFPAMARKRVGPLPMHSASAGDQVGARGCQLQRRGTTFPGGTSASQPRTAGQEPP